MDRQYLMQQLRLLGLERFYENVVKLAMHWFRGDEGDDLTRSMAEFVYSGGLYGSVKNARANSVAKGSRLSFLMNACFPGYQEMCSMYPWLKKCPVALPVTWGIRGVDSLIHRRGNIKTQFEACAKGDEDHGKKLQQFYRDCGL